MGAAEQWPVPDEQKDVDRQEQEQEHSYFGMDHGTAVVLYEEQEVAGKVEEEEPTGVSEGSVIVRGYRVSARLVRFVVRSIVGYSRGLDP